MISKTFSSDGALGKAIEGFQPRQAQSDMAEAVLTAIEEQTQLVIEAGTGTGKTFAYLVPVLLSGKKAIISTGSKNLSGAAVSPRFAVDSKCFGLLWQYFSFERSFKLPLFRKAE